MAKIVQKVESISRPRLGQYLVRQFKTFSKKKKKNLIIPREKKRKLNGKTKTRLGPDIDSTKAKIGPDTDSTTYMLESQGGVHRYPLSSVNEVSTFFLDCSELSLPKPSPPVLDQKLSFGFGF